MGENSGGQNVPGGKLGGSGAEIFSPLPTWCGTMQELPCPLVGKKWGVPPGDNRSFIKKKRIAY
jgi:hypothetical protein